MAETQNMPLERPAIASVKGFSTADMMRAMCIGSNKLQSAVEEIENFVDSENFKQMVLMEHAGADNYNKTREEPEALQQVRRIVEGNIATLSSSKDTSAITSRNAYQAEYTEKNNRMAELDKKRAQLLTEAKESRTTLARELNKIAKDIGTRSDADIKADLKKFSAPLKTLAKEIKDLKENEDKATRDLHDLVTRTSSTARNLGLPVTEAITPTRRV